ncbi:MAG: HEAT repeat domain-containing protein, partial [Candidatus Geothermincolales bacterium]
MEAKRDVEGLIQALSHDDKDIRVNAALALGKLKNAGAVKALVEALRDDHEDVRWAAAWSLGEIGKPAVRPLVQALKDEEGEVRWKAAWALEKMGRQVLDSLLDAFAVEEGEAKSKIAMVLGSIGDVRAVRPLVQALGDLDESVRFGARWALQKLGGAVVRSLVKTLEEEDDPQARADAAVALGVIGDSSAVPSLVAALSDHDERVREAAERALVEIGDKKAIPSLESLLKTSDERVREHAHRVLAGLGWAPGDKEERIEFLLKHGNWDKVLELGEEVIPRIVEALSGHGEDARREVARSISASGQRMKARLLELLTDEDETIRREASFLAREIADESLFSYLEGAMESDDPVVRKNVALALARVRTPEAVEVLIKAMGDQEDDVAKTASWALGQMGELSAGRLIEALGSPEARVRRGAAWALGVIKDARSVEPLIRALKDTDEKVRKGAAWALGEMGDLAAEALSKSLEDPEIREAVRNILERIGWEEKEEVAVSAGEEKPEVSRELTAAPIVREAEEIVTEILDRMGIGEQAREDRAEVLIERQDWDGLLEMGEDALPSLVDALKDPDPQIRAKAAWCLGVMGSERAVEPLLEALGDASRDVRLSVAGALKKIGHPAVEPLIRALREGDEELRKEAARVLGDLGDERAVRPLVEALTDRDEKVRGRVVASLVKLGEPAVAMLQEAARSVSDEMRRMANLVLVKMGRKRPEEAEVATGIPEEVEASEADLVTTLIERGEWERVATLGSVAFSPLINALKHDDPDRRKGAAWALGVMRDERAVEYLAKVLTEDEPQVRRAAAWALGVIGDPRGVPSLIAALKDEDPEVRRKAAWALGEIGDERAKEPLILALQDPDNDVKRVASLVLERMGWEPTEMVSEIRAMIASRKWDSLAGMGEVAVQALIEALDDEDPETREKAAWALGEIGDVRAVEPLIRKLGDDAAAVRIKAAWSLGKIGDERAREPLSQALQDE